MLDQDFTDLDEDYITLMSEYLVYKDKKLHFLNMQRLAEFGQINAIQEYFILKPEDYSNSVINFNTCKLLLKEENSFEDLFALGLYLDKEANKTEDDIEIFQDILEVDVSKYNLSKKLAQRLYAKAIETGRKRANESSFNNKKANAVVFERLAEIDEYLEQGGKYSINNIFAKEGVRREYQKNAADDLNIYLASRFVIRNNKELKSKGEAKLMQLSTRPLKVRIDQQW